MNFPGSQRSGDIIPALETCHAPSHAAPVLVGADRGLAPVMAQASQVARTDTSVLITGETGVGKGRVAALIHKTSRRKKGPFITVNCGAITDTLLDSELFGHEKGAFTGAFAQKIGRFERAHKGTIFLDEIGEMTLQAQVRLLNVLQEHKIERVGGSRSVNVDIRVICATHQDLDTMVCSKQFRKDLWFRLNVFPIHIPPLRQRQEDISALVHHFLAKKANEMDLTGVPVPRRTCLKALETYDWPGNVRELENLIERAMVRFQGRSLDLAGLIPEVCPPPSSPPIVSQYDSFLSLDQVNRVHILNALSASGGRINGRGGAAHLLEIHPNTLRKRMDKLGISYRKKDRPPAVREIQNLGVYA